MNREGDPAGPRDLDGMLEFHTADEVIVGRQLFVTRTDRGPAIMVDQPQLEQIRTVDLRDVVKVVNIATGKEFRPKGDDVIDQEGVI